MIGRQNTKSDLDKILIKNILMFFNLIEKKDMTTNAHYFKT